MRRLVPIIAGLFAVVLAGCITTGGTEPAQPTVSPSTEYHHGEIRRVPSATGCIALTFDDGPHPSLTPRLLSILAEENAVATFFLVGQRVQQWPNIATTIRRAGHEIGNHSWSHAALTRLSTDAVAGRSNAPMLLSPLPPAGSRRSFGYLTTPTARGSAA